MNLKLIKDENFKIGLIDFNGEPITELLFHKDLLKIFDGVLVRYSIWSAPFEEKMVRMFGHERVWDFRDFPNMPYVPTIILNQFEIELSSLIVSIEKLSQYALTQNPNINPYNLYFLQMDFLKRFGKKYIFDPKLDDFSTLSSPKIIDLTSIGKHQSKVFNSLFKEGLFFRCSGTCFAISSEYIFINGINENECEYREIGIESLLEFALLDVKQFTSTDKEIFKLLSVKPREINSEQIFNFLNEQAKINYDIASNRFLNELDREVRIGHFIYDPRV